MKITQEILTEIAMKYLAEHTPLSKLAKEYGTSKTTLVRYFNGQGTVTLSPGLQAQVDIVKQQNWIDGKSTSGNAGHKKLTDDEVVRLAEFMVDNDLTLEELVSVNTPVKSRLFALFTEERLGSQLYGKILSQYEANKQGAFDEYNDHKKGKK